MHRHLVPPFNKARRAIGSKNGVWDFRSGILTGKGEGHSEHSLARNPELSRLSFAANTTSLEEDADASSQHDRDATTPPIVRNLTAACRPRAGATACAPRQIVWSSSLARRPRQYSRDLCPLH